MKTISLNGTWNLTGTSPCGEALEINASVPGCALNEVIKLSENKDKNDIFYRDNADFFVKYENYSWKYTKTFNIEEISDKAELIFERLDTYCDVYLNDVHLGYRENGNIPHSFDVKESLVCGENTLVVYLYSPVTRVHGKKKLSGAFTTERLHTRRMQCTYGWDWTMRFVTSGIGDVSLKLYNNGLRVKSAYVYTTDIDKDAASIGIDMDISDYRKGAIIKAEIISPDGTVVYSHEKYCEEDFVRLYATVENPLLWYPTGFGSQPLYKLEISVSGEMHYQTLFGIRTVKILEIVDKEGSENYNKCLFLKEGDFPKIYDRNDKFSSFILKINGIKIMCKGANWVPCEPFTKGENNNAKITEILEMSKSMGVNMIRVWGGGAFECRHFYDECSRLGILVTQDFLMACGNYPEKEDWFLRELTKEAEYATELLRNSPCLVWWTGDNENATAGSDVHTDYNGRSSAYKAIAPVLYQKDFTRRFLPSSPYGGKLYASVTAGTTHNTNRLGEIFSFIDNGDISDYKNHFKKYSARFIAEEPVFGACEKDTLSKFMTDEDIFGDDRKMWLYHTKGNPDLAKELYEYFHEFTEKLFDGFCDGYDRLFKYKYMQYEWVRISMERARRDKWFCSGMIYWMLNDCWPAAAGWSLIDYYNKPKAAYYAFKKCALPIILSIDSENGVYKFHACNDSLYDRALCLKIFAVDENGSICKTFDDVNFTSKANESDVIFTLSEKEIPEKCFITAQIEDDKGVIDRSFFRKGLLNLKKCSDDAIEIKQLSGNKLELTARKYIHAVCVETTELLCDNYFSMLPNETKTVTAADITAYSF